MHIECMRSRMGADVDASILRPLLCSESAVDDHEDNSIGLQLPKELLEWIYGFLSKPHCVPQGVPLVSRPCEGHGSTQRRVYLLLWLLRPIIWVDARHNVGA